MKLFLVGFLICLYASLGSGQDGDGKETSAGGEAQAASTDGKETSTNNEGKDTSNNDKGKDASTDGKDTSNKDKGKDASTDGKGNNNSTKDVDCKNLVAEASNPREFKKACAKKGSTAKCCTLPVGPLGLLCQDATGTGL